MNFKDILQEDNETTFMNPEEYGERHIVNGRSMNIIIDDYGLLERESGKKVYRLTGKECTENKCFFMYWRKNSEHSRL